MSGNNGKTNSGQESTALVKAKLPNPTGINVSATPEFPYDLNLLSAAVGRRSESSGASLIDYFWSVLHRKWTILTFLVLGLAGAYVHIQRAIPYYLSSAVIEIEKAVPASANLGDLFAFFGQFELFYLTQLEAVKSPDVAVAYLRLAEQAEREAGSLEKSSSPGSKTEEVKPGPVDAARAEIEQERSKAAKIGGVLSSVTANPIKRTQLIEVQMGANDPLEARRRLRIYLQAYIQYCGAKQEEAKAKLRGWLQRELVEARTKLKESEDEFLDFTVKHGLPVFDKHPAQATNSFEKAGSELVTSKSARLDLEGLARTEGKFVRREMDAAYLDSVKRQLSALETKYSEMRAIYSSDYFGVLAVRQKIESLRDTIADIERKQVENALEAARKKEAVAQEAYDKAKQDAANISSLAVQYDIHRKAVEANSRIFMILLQRSKEAELEHGVMGHTVVVSSAPTLPLGPVYPHKPRIMLIGAMLGLLGGILAAVAREYLDDTVQNTREMQRHLNVPILGSVPRLENGAARRGRQADGPTGLEFTPYHSPASAFSDAARIVQNTTAAYMPADSTPVICISSAGPTEGKTLLTIVMGAVIASEGKKALVIDADMRKPRVHKAFGDEDRGPGLTDLITGKVQNLVEVIRASKVPGLYYLPVGYPPENPVSLLKSPRFRDILAACRSTFDEVLVDTPPILGIADARVVAGCTDGMILVTRAGHTPVTFVQQAAEAIQQIDGRVLGIVLNMTGPRGDGYRGNYYRSRYYHYYHRQQEAGKS
jgi:capsular exopolysaccharide synthesis family protein